jgi:cytochrome c oxidase assembly protein subunit 15
VCALFRTYGGTSRTARQEAALAGFRTRVAQPRSKVAHRCGATSIAKVNVPKISPKTYSRIALAALISLIVITITGAAVRVTGSGLGCEDWPNCHENQFVARMSFHSQVEWINRLFTGVVSVAVILAAAGAALRTPRRKDLVLLALSLILGVAAQAVLGGFTVRHELDPRFVMAHFLLSMLLIWAGAALTYRARQPDTRPVAIVHRDYRILGRAMFVLTAVVLFVGTMVTGSGPHGGDEHVDRLDFALHDITRVHGALVWTLIFVTVVTMWRLRVAGASSTLLKKGEYCVAAMLVQGLIGYVQYALHLPAALALLHVAGAVAVWVSVVWFNLSFFDRYESQDLPVYDGDAYPGADFFMTSGPPPEPQLRPDEPKT